MKDSFRKSSVVVEYCKKYPDAPAKTLARRILKDHPRLYPNLEVCYSAVRRAFGVHGDRNRTQINQETKSLNRKTRPAGWSIPIGLTHHFEWSPYEIDGTNIRAGIINDVHAPYHSQKHLTQALETCVDDKCNVLLLNGDMCDFYAASSYQTDPRKRDLAAERDSVCDILANIRKALPRARIVFKNGNHEERWFRYICNGSPDLLDLPEVSIKAMFKLDAMKIEQVPDRRPIGVGSFMVLHGHELGPMYKNPVSPARGYWMRALCNSVFGHLHQPSTFTAMSPVTRQEMTAITGGCLCDIHPDYAPMNNWQHGMVRLDVNKSGKTTVHNIVFE